MVANGALQRVPYGGPAKSRVLDGDPGEPLNYARQSWHYCCKLRYLDVPAP
jgi:hypothetical protein